MSPVVHIRSLPDDWQENPAFDEHVYIGRHNPKIKGPFTWENRFREGAKYKETGYEPATLEQTMLLYDWELLTKMDSPQWRVSVHKLHGKTLVCWCKSYKLPDGSLSEEKPCHGDVLLHRAAELHRIAMNYTRIRDKLNDESAAAEERLRTRMALEARIHAMVESIKVKPPLMRTPEEVRATLDPIFQLCKEKERT